MLSWYQLLAWVCSQPPCHTRLPLPALLMGEDFAKSQSQGFCIFLARLVLGNPASAACPVHVGGEKFELRNNAPWPSTDRNSRLSPAPHYQLCFPTAHRQVKPPGFAYSTCITASGERLTKANGEKKNRATKMKHRPDWQKGMSMWLQTRRKQNFCTDIREFSFVMDMLPKPFT